MKEAHHKFLKAAISEAKKSALEGGIPIGSVLVHNGKIVGSGHNRRVQEGSAILHGEMSALENAGRRSAKFYQDCEIYTTLSPCPMCSGAIILYGIKKVIIGENSTFLGEETLLRSKGIDVVVLDDNDCKEMMQDFINKHPELWNEDIGED
ncbi:MAG: nucleoside deaminase [Bacteroidia bacterium]|nr:nucleoside deaminase [Bacteroidia bacterium]NND25472.1 nucleoside deaminase [Flavobacteriaceae bacterium]MBT8277619.1 nucleoside deaminase [Bacteroidia bacterium]NNK60554.1 nucleoside deaminase [Flavobacteriaceae bacterium]NNL31953.1 nucleoside deaminase [Flavobacteriaceae bacterium]